MYGMNWKETIAVLTKDFAAFGCRYKGKKLRETALGYDCTELFFWNWMDGECDRSDRGRVNQRNKQNGAPGRRFVVRKTKSAYGMMPFSLR